MKILFDTNVVLDVLLDREPFSTLGAQLFSCAERGELAGYLCATTVTTVHYLARKVAGPERARKDIRKLLTLFEVAPVNRPVLEAALGSRISDFEDAVICEAALHAEAQAIVTRDPRGFRRARIPVYSPEEFYSVLQARR